MKLKIISDGTNVFSGGTKVVNAETNEELQGVQSITWTCSALNDNFLLPKVRLTLIDVSVELIGETKKKEKTMME